MISCSYIDGLHALVNVLFSAMQSLLRMSGDRENALLVMLGSSRHREDDALVDLLRRRVDTLQLQRHIHIYTNLSYSLLSFILRHAEIGLHTMWNEHFGISVVEMMATGLVVVAHDSGGPRTDIVSDACNGFRASTADEYAEKIAFILDNPSKMKDIKVDAMIAARRFSDEKFSKKIINEFNLILNREVVVLDD